MEMGISLEELEGLKDYINNTFIKDMNKAGVSFSAMALAVNTLLIKIEEFKKSMINYDETK